MIGADGSALVKRGPSDAYELTNADAFVHRSDAAAVQGLVDLLSAERVRVPDDALRDAERLECLLFRGYDPCFEDDAPQRDCDAFLLCGDTNN